MAAPAAPPIPAADIRCTQCGGVLHPGEGQLFLICPYCSSSVYLDKSKVVFHWSLARTVSPEAAAANLRRWMAGNHTVKDLDRKSKVTATTFEYFPLWYCTVRSPGGKDQVYLEPAAAISVSEIKSLAIPAGDLQKYDLSLDAQAVAPSVPFPAMLQWLQGRGVAPEQVREAALVHLPIYIFKYQFGGRTYTAMVEGASGKVFANIFPEKAEAPYFIVAAISVGGYLLLSTFPLIGFFVGDAAGLFAGLGACLVGGALFALPVFALAAWVSAKV